MLALTTSGWTAVIVGASIFGPVVVTIWLTWFFFRAARNDPDHERLKRAQAEYEARQRER